MRRSYPTLAAYLKQTGTSQVDFARRVGTTQPAISKILAGKRRPGLRIALRIAEAARIPLESLLTAARDDAA